MLVADLDLDDIVRAKYDFDVVGHYSRPDIFRLSVDRSARQPVSFTGEFGRSSSIAGNHAGPERSLVVAEPTELGFAGS